MNYINSSIIRSYRVLITIIISCFNVAGGTSDLNCMRLDKTTSFRTRPALPLQSLMSKQSEKTVRDYAVRSFIIHDRSSKMT